MTGYETECWCQPDLVSEWRQLVGQLPTGVLGEADFTIGGRGAGCEVLGWASSGLMHLTGADAPAAPSAPVLARTALATEAIARLAHRYGEQVRLDPWSMLASRAGECGFSRRGTESANRSCRLIPAADGWLAVNLARDTDVLSLPAVLGHDLGADPWADLTAYSANSAAADVAAAAQFVGIPAAALGTEPAKPVAFVQAGEPGDAARLVLDLSAMWAGPLCASILRRAGWRVLKVEDARRPDGARLGPSRFYAELHAGIPTVRLDFSSPAGRSELASLACEAGIIVESSRPRALRGLGLIAEDWLAASAGRIWVSVTGYGRDDPHQRVAFGDDAAVAGGLICRLPEGTPVFCGDAIADPLTGLHAGLAALAAHAAGGGFLVDAALASVSANLARPAAGSSYSHAVALGPNGWTASHGQRSELVRWP